MNLRASVKTCGLFALTSLLASGISWGLGSIYTIRTLLLEKSVGDVDQVVPMAGGFLVRNTDLLKQQRQSLEVFDTSGRVTRTIGKFGRRPGSFQALKSVAVEGNGTIWAADLLGRLSFFDPQGRLLGTKLVQAPGFQVDGLALDERRGLAYLSGCLPIKVYVELGCKTIHQYRLKDRQYLRSFHDNDAELRERNLLAFSDNHLDVDAWGIVWTVDAPILKLSRVDPKTGAVQRFPIRSSIAKPIPKPKEGADLNALMDDSFLLDRVLVASGGVVVSIRGPKGTGWHLAVFDLQGRQEAADLKSPGLLVGKTRDGELLFSRPAKGGYELVVASVKPKTPAAAKGRR